VFHGPINIQGSDRMVSSSVVVPKSGLYAEPRADWLAQYSEDIIDPARRIIDPHHHLWDRQGGRYLLEELTDDIATGHNIVATVYVDCRSMYRASGPEAFKPVGEVEFANGVAAQSASGGYGSRERGFACDRVVGLLWLCGFDASSVGRVGGPGSRDGWDVQPCGPRTRRSGVGNGAVRAD